MTQDQQQHPTPRQKPRIRTWLTAIGVAIAIIVAFATGHWTGHRHASHNDDAAHQHLHEGHAADPAAAQVYYCPMHPDERSTNPNDRCPICGMALVPLTQEDDADEGPRTITLSPRAIALLNVQTAPARRQPVTADLRLVGRIDYDETRLATIAARVPGRIDRLMVDFTGTQVRRGQPMAELYSPELLAAQEELIQAAAALQNVRNGNDTLRRSFEATLLATRDRLRLWGLTNEQIEQIERQATPQEHITLLAPIGGIVVEKDALEGMYVETGDRIYSIADLSHLWVQLEAYETDLPWLRLGQTVSFTAQAFPGRTFEGTVSFISPTVDDRTRTTRVRVDLPNENLLLKPGMFVRGQVQAEPPAALASADPAHAGHAVHAAPDAQPLVIPASAALITGRRAVVYVQHPDRERPTFEGRDVVLGPRVGKNFIVESGLKEGELVVTNGNFKLDAELQLRGRISMMAPEGGGAVGHEHHGHDATAAPTEEPPQQVEVSEQFSSQVGAVVQAHFNLVDALAHDEPDRARAAAERTRAQLESVDMRLVEGAAHDLWMTMQRTMDRALEQLIESEDLAVMRRHFETFSDELTRVVRTFGTGDVAPVYRAMCPMVEDRRGYWLQPERPITNPYYGEAMYRCGEITETLVE